MKIKAPAGNGFLVKNGYVENSISVKSAFSANNEIVFSLQQFNSRVSSSTLSFQKLAIISVSNHKSVKYAKSV